jgi:hypothetical protein
VEEHVALAAFAKFIRITETRGRSGARDVVVRMKDVVPPAPHTTAPVELKCADSSEENNVRPSGHKYVFAELVISYETRRAEQGWRTTPTVPEHADAVEFTLEILIQGRPYSTARFRIENTWSSDRIGALLDDAWPPAIIDFPTINRA